MIEVKTVKEPDGWRVAIVDGKQTFMMTRLTLAWARPRCYKHNAIKKTARKPSFLIGATIYSTSRSSASSFLSLWLT
jgi:hypothetical protein